MTKSIWTVLACLMTTGCMTVQPLPVDRQQLASELEPGDRVEVVTKDGRRLELEVDGVDEQGLRGTSQQILYSDIETLSRKKVSVGRTALVALGAAAVIAAVAGGGGGSGSGY